MEQLYKEMQERLRHLEAQEQTEEIKCRIAEITLAIVRVQQLLLANVVWQSEPCGLLHSTDWNGKCFKCGEQVFVRESK